MTALTAHDTHAAKRARALAHPNIALIKYWGKAADLRDNEPAVSSLSITLDTLVTDTELCFAPDLTSDQLVLNGRQADEKLPRISRNLDRLRTLSGCPWHCRINSTNNFPTAAGLASSASGFAALVEAGNAALELQLDFRQKSMLARAMSGSAARSVGGGFVKIYLPHGREAEPGFGRTFAETVAEPSHWPLEICVAIVSEAEKAVGSTDGMELSRHTSPYYPAWLEGNDRDVLEAEQAVLARDFEKLSELAEFSCLKMHAMAMASRPGLLYWQGATMAAMQRVRELRRDGVPVFFTVDAGPQVKAVCAPGYGERVAQALAELDGVQRVLRCGLGQGARGEALRD